MTKVVVVGASSGLGRSIGLGLAGRGARVAFLGRRLDRLRAAAAEAGAGALAMRCDVLDGDACASAVEGACAELGGADALVYCAGVGPLARLVDTTPAMWRDVLGTNVVGAAVATQAALRALTASRGRALYLSSVSASLTPPWPGLGAYAASKAALDKLIEAWHGEHPEVAFTRVIVGDTAGGTGHGATEFAAGWDADLAAEHFPRWVDRGYLSGGLVAVDELVAVAASLLVVDADVPTVAITPRPPPSAARRPNG